MVDGLGASREKGALENGNDIISGGGVLSCGEKSAFVPYSSCDLERGRESGVWMDKERSSMQQRRTISAAKSVKDRSCIGEQKMWRALIGQVDKLLA